MGYVHYALNSSSNSVVVAVGVLVIVGRPCYGRVGTFGPEHFGTFLIEGAPSLLLRNNLLNIVEMSLVSYNLCVGCRISPVHEIVHTFAATTFIKLGY